MWKVSLARRRLLAVLGTLSITSTATAATVNRPRNLCSQKALDKYLEFHAIQAEAVFGFARDWEPIRGHHYNLRPMVDVDRIQHRDDWDIWERVDAAWQAAFAAADGVKNGVELRLLLILRDLRRGESRQYYDRDFPADWDGFSLPTTSRPKDPTGAALIETIRVMRASTT